MTAYDTLEALHSRLKAAENEGDADAAIKWAKAYRELAAALRPNPTPNVGLYEITSSTECELYAA